MSRLLAALWLLACTSPALAQGHWLVTEVRAGDASSDASKTAARVAEILRARGVTVIDGLSAASEIEHKHSRSPIRLQPDELERLDLALRTLADHLASENLAEARAALEEVERLTPDARDYLNRQVNRARRRFHTCLLAAHLFAKEGYDDDAFEQVRKCARDFPGFEPEELEYMPDSIKAFFGRARAELASILPATLNIDIEPTSEEQCRARVNGIDKGALPARVADVRTDAVRVQLECDGRSGRIYTVAMQPGDNGLVIDPQLDRAIDTVSTLLLHYPSTAVAGELREKHGIELARAIGAGQMLEVFGGQITRLDVASRSKVAEADLSRSSLEEAVDTVLRASTEDATPIAATHPAPVEATKRSSVLEPLTWVSLGAASVAVGAFGVSWVVRELSASAFSEPRCLSSDDPDRPTRREQCPDEYETVQTAESIMIGSGIAAGVFGGLAALFYALDSNDRSEHAPTARVSRCTSGPGELGAACTISF